MDERRNVEPENRERDEGKPAEQRRNELCCSTRFVGCVALCMYYALTSLQLSCRYVVTQLSPRHASNNCMIAVHHTELIAGQLSC